MRGHGAPLGGGQFTAGRIAAKRLLDFVQRDPGALGDLDDGDVAQHHGGKAALVAAVAGTRNQALAFVKMNGRNRNASALGDFAHGHQAILVVAGGARHRA